MRRAAKVDRNHAEPAYPDPCPKCGNETFTAPRWHRGWWFMFTIDQSLAWTCLRCGYIVHKPTLDDL